jgi:hypothetical protein
MLCSGGEHESADGGKQGGNSGMLHAKASLCAGSTVQVKHPTSKVIWDLPTVVL